LTKDVKSAGGTPVRLTESNLVSNVSLPTSFSLVFQILITPLTRRSFTSAHTAADSLHNERLATISAAQDTNTLYLDLNAASLNYVDAIGETASRAYSLKEGDNTHLNAWGSVVFGRVVADLLIERRKCLVKWVEGNETMSRLIREGLPA
jgi:lysophospholipase L1-like esterase